MTPMPPACAMAIAMRPSVTVSMAADRMGSASSISRVRRVRMLTAAGSTADAAGFSSTSSKVRYSGMESERRREDIVNPFEG